MNLHKKYICFFSWCLLFLFALLFVVNEKTYIFVILFYGAVLFFYFRLDLIKTIFFTLLLSLSFGKGIRGWTVEAVAPDLRSWIYGYSFYFGLTLRVIFAITLMLLTIFSRNKKIFRVKSSSFGSSGLLMIFLAVVTISTLLAEDLALAGLGMTHLVISLWLFAVSLLLFRNVEIKILFTHLLISLLIFFGAIGSIQFINQSSLGVFLEDNAFRTPLGIFTSDGEKLYRVAGLTGHPTFFGAYLSLLLPVCLGAILSLERKTGWHYLVLTGAFFLGSLALLGTLSRSGWISFVVSLSIFGYKLLRIKTRKLLFRFLAPVVVIILMIITLYGSLLITRMESFSGLWSIGNGKGRLMLIQNAFSMSIRKPIFGVGLNHFTKELARQATAEEVGSFLFPVHNTWLLIISELGIPAGLIFSLFIYKSFFHGWRQLQNDWIKMGVWVGAFSFLINSQFHTLFSQDPSFDVFMIMLGYLASL